MTYTPQNHLVACVTSIDVHLFLNCHLWFELLWHLYYWLVIFHQPIILHKDIRHSIVETVNILKMWIQNKTLTDLWIQQSQECPNQYKLLFHLLTISYTLLQCTGFIRKKKVQLSIYKLILVVKRPFHSSPLFAHYWILKFQRNHHSNRERSTSEGIVSCGHVQYRGK